MKQRKIGLAAYYNRIMQPRGFSAAPHHYPIFKALEDERIDNLLYLAGPGTGKSMLLDTVYASWELGHEPALTILSVSAGESLPKGFMLSVMQIIQHDKTWAEIFPEVRPDPMQGWSIQRGLFVNGHNQSEADASYQAVGITSKQLTGLHARLHIYDDLHDNENASSAEARKGVRDKYYNTLMGRADPQRCRKVAAGRWFAKDDLYQELIGNGDWVVMELPAVRDGEYRLWYDVMVPHGQVNIFTETAELVPDQDPRSPYVKYRVYYGAVDPTKKGFYWPDSKVKRHEYLTVERNEPRVAAINYRGDMTGGGDAIFRPEDFRVYTPPEDLAMGIQSTKVRSWIASTQGIIEESWDTALGQSKSTSKTAALTGLFVPCDQWHTGEDSMVIGPCDFHYDLYLMDLMVEDLDFAKLAMALRQRFGKWHPRRVNIEEKQSGVGLIQTFKGSAIPVRGLKVQQGKVERAVNAIVGDDSRPIAGGAASAQGWQRMGRVLVPAGAKWVEEGTDGKPESGFMNRVCSFTGGTNAVADEFDTMVHLITRAIAMSIKGVKIGGIDNHGPSDEEVAIANSDDPRRRMLEAIGLQPMIADISENPYRGLCIAPCAHYGVVANQEWCGFHGRRTNSLQGCQQWVERNR